MSKTSFGGPVFLARMIKQGDVVTQLLPHQQRVVDKMMRPDQSGLVVAHGLGSGKTLTSIAAQDALGLPASVILPAALQDNYMKEREKHLSGETQPIDMTTLQTVARRGTPPTGRLLIVDEAHRARDPATKGSQALRKSKADKRMLLTATPFYNAASDIAPLVNIAAGDSVLPVSPGEFKSRYVREKTINPGWWGRTFRGETPGTVEEVNPERVNELRQIFAKYVDYHPSATEGFPDVTRAEVRVPMTREQLKIYDTLMSQAPPWVAAKIKAGLPPSKRESQDLNAFLGGVRQVSNTTAAHAPGQEVQKPKIDQAFQNLMRMLKENEHGKAVVYSNYLDAGLRPYADMLEQSAVPYGLFTGEQKKEDRDQMVRDYNEGKLRALLLSSAGGEGLDLKGTRLMQVLDPHWNDEKLHQVEGRGIRYGSHASLPEDERNIRVERYLATRPRSGLLERMNLKQPGGGVDEFLTMRSAEKEKLHKQFRQLFPGAEKTAALRKLAVSEGYKLRGHTKFQGIPIAVENRKGDVRSGQDKDGHKWRTVMQHPYGYIKGTKGADGEEVDVYVGPGKKAPMAYVVHQRKADGKSFDEDKVMLGFEDRKSAREAFLKHYDDPKFLGPISAVPVETLKKKIETGERLEKISAVYGLWACSGAICNKNAGNKG